MTATSNEYSALRFNPFDIDCDIEVAYPELKPLIDGNEYLQKVREEERKGLQVYVILAYDPDSPLRKKYQDSNSRKERAMEIAGVDKSSALAQSIMEGRPEIVAYIVGFLRIVNSRLYTLITINEETFYEYSSKVLSPIAGTGMDEKDVLNAATIKNKLLEACDEISQRLDRYYREYTGDDDSISMAVSKAKAWAPEAISKMKPSV